MTSLKDFGWNDFHQHNFNESHNHGELVARVVSVQGFKHHLVTANGELEAELAGRLLYGSEAEDLPKVGDWVCYLDYGHSGYIIERLPRRNMLSRKTPGKKNDRQVLGANIDYAIIVQGLDRDFNVMRLDRYITQIVACGIEPIVVLNKIDLVPDPDTFVQLVNELKRDVKIYCCSTLTRTGISALQDLQKEKTYIMIGSSGVGKSSILNVLMNTESQQTAEISDFNGRGRHTTTSRELFMLPNGSLLMDTPGMREFGVTSEDGSDELMFPAIEALAVNCKYGDCSHMSEEGCAVLYSLETGVLDVAIYESFVKLVKEQRRFGIRAEEKKRMNKQSGKISRETNSFRKKNKY
ncbi:MAG: ribosome small subunit-dependent GTPase A [Bacteroidota bacterium]